MSWTEAFTNTATIGTTPHSLTNNSTVIAARTDKGTYQVVIDLAALASGDQFELRVLEKARTTSDQRRLLSSFISGGGSEILMTPPLMLGNGWDITLTKLAGTDRSIDWSIRAY